MKIHGDKPYLPVDPSHQTGAAAPTAKKAGQSQEPSTSEDRVDLSPKAKEMQQAAQALADTPEVREAKVAELKRAVDSGAYNVNAEQIAEKMVKDTLLDMLL